jgi:ElaB/YqjD/DUF883 family membrane-anchored ribosome-binding protein
MTDAPELETATTSRSVTSNARRSMEHTYDAARDTAGKALTRASEGARDAARRAGDAVSDNPISVLVGGIAIGALAGSLLPRSKREIEALRPVGKKINVAASAAADAAKQAGKAELVDLSLTRDGARDQATRLIDGVLRAVASAGSAAVDSAKSAKKA